MIHTFKTTYRKLFVITLLLCGLWFIGQGSYIHTKAVLAQILLETSWSKTLKGQKKVKPWEYINGGFQIVNKKHKQLFTDIIKFYWENSDKLIYAQETFKVGTDQTVINYLLKNSP